MELGFGAWPEFWTAWGFLRLSQLRIVLELGSPASSELVTCPSAGSLIWLCTNDTRVEGLRYLNHGPWAPVLPLSQSGLEEVAPPEVI